MKKYTLRCNHCNNHFQITEAEYTPDTVCPKCGCSAVEDITDDEDDEFEDNFMTINDIINN